MAKKRTLLVSLGIVDERFAAKLASLRRTIRRWARRVTGLFTGPLKALTSLRTAVLGIGLALAARAGAASFQGVIDTTDQLTKLATATGDAVENLSELRFALQLNGIEAGRFDQVLVELGRTQAQALQGMPRYVKAFEDLGISVRDLQELSPSQLFEKIAVGLEQFGSEQERASKLQLIFSRNFQRLLPLLGRGVRTFQDSIREGRAYGATITEMDGKVSELVNDSLLRMRTAVEDVQRALITTFGDDASAFLSRFAQGIADNKEEVVEYARTAAESLVSAFRLSLDFVLTSYETIQNLRRQLGYDVPTPHEQLLRESARQEEVILKVRAGLANAAIEAERLGLTVELTRGQFNRLGEEAKRQAPSIQALFEGVPGAQTIAEALERARGTQAKARQRAIQKEEEAWAAFGLTQRDLIEQRFESFFFEVEAIGSRLQKSGFAAPFEIQVAATDESLERYFDSLDSIFKQGTGGPNTLVQSTDEASAAVANAVKGYEDLVGAVQTAGLASEEFLAVQQQLSVEAIEIDLARSYVEGSVDAQEFHRIQEEILAGQERLREESDKDLSKNIREARRAFLELLPPTQKTREELQQIAREEQIEAFREIAAAAGIAADEIDKMVAKLEKVRGGGSGGKRGLTGSAGEELEEFGVGFRSASDAAAEFYTSARAGADAYRSIQDGLVDSINDWVSGTKSAKEAFADLGRTVLQELQKIIIRLIVVRALNSVFGSEVGTPTGNANGGIQTGTIVGTTSVQGFANGGVSDGPTLALFGEGRYRREAFVPLPDGRRIPVDLQNAGGGDSVPTVQFIFQGGDGDSIRRMLKKEESTIIGIVSRAAGTNTGLRRAIGRN